MIHGDGAVYQRVKFNALTFKPEVGEVVEGTVCEVVEFGAFVRFGPLDGLLHMSQIMKDRRKSKRPKPAEPVAVTAPEIPPALEARSSRL